MSDLETNPLLRLLPRVILCQPLDGAQKLAATNQGGSHRYDFSLCASSIRNKGCRTDKRGNLRRVLMIPLIG